MNIDLTGRTAVVAESAEGMGRAIAEGLARAGAAVVISGRGQAKVATTLCELRQLFPKVEFIGVSADLAAPDGAAKLFGQAPEADILVNNVSNGRPKSFFDISEREWIDLFELNVMSGIRTARHYLPNMTKRGWGRVVFVSRGSTLEIPKDMVHYAMTKTAQLAIARGLAEEVGGTGVTVNSVLPGPTSSDFMEDWMKTAATEQGITQQEAERQFLKANRPTSLLNRFATTEEIANLVVYVCSEQASATTGTALRFDDGIIRMIA